MKNEELARFGIQAYQAGEYAGAIEFLTELVRREPQLWTCRLYLAMALQYAGRTAQAKAELSTLSEWATDQTIKRKALEALRALNSLHEIKPAAHKKNVAVS